jgi:DNA polymerase alpha-associated DNA helicase A
MVPAAKATDIASFASTQQTLLAAELAAELAESASQTTAHSPAALQRAGAALAGLVAGGTRTGFGGRTLLDLEPDAATAAVGGGGLPEHGVRVGDIVRVLPMVAGAAKKKSEEQAVGVDGVVARVGEARVCVALDKEDVEIPGGRLWM